MIKEYKIVKSIKKLSETVQKGTVGTVLVVYTNPSTGI